VVLQCKYIVKHSLFNNAQQILAQVQTNGVSYSKDSVCFAQNMLKGFVHSKVN